MPAKLVMLIKLIMLIKLTKLILLTMLVMLIMLTKLVMLIMLIKVREGNAEQPLALAVDDDGLIAMVDTQKQVLNFDQHPILINFQKSENITRIRKA